MEKDDVPGNVDANQGIPKTAGKSNKELQDPSKLQVSGFLLSWTCCIYVCLHSAMVSNAVLSILRCRLNENRFPGCSINLRLWGLGSCWNKRKTVKRSKPILLTRAARSHQSCQQSAALHDSATIWCYVEGYFALLLRGRGPTAGVERWLRKNQTKLHHDVFLLKKKEGPIRRHFIRSGSFVSLASCGVQS